MCSPCVAVLDRRDDFDGRSDGRGRCGNGDRRGDLSGIWPAWGSEVARAAQGGLLLGGIAHDASARRWRCRTGNYLHDPCFSSAYASGIVLCPDAPWLKTGVKIRLTTTLPYAHGNRSAPSLRAEPWAIELYGGRHCLFSSGASNVVQGKRLNYFCGASSQEGLWGFPYRGSEPWTILIAPLPASVLSELAAVRRAWM